jgi:hypothetical protein
LKEAQEKIATLESDQNKELEDLKARESYLKTLNKVSLFLVCQTPFLKHYDRH